MGKGGFGKSKGVKDIVETWQLNADSQEVLLSLDAYTAANVLNQFEPRNAEGRDVNGMFITFARGVQSKGKGGGKRGKSIAQFVSDWALDDNAQGALFRLPPDQFAEVMANFKPNTPEGADVTGKLIKFAASVRNNQNFGKGKMMDPMGALGKSFGKSFGKGKMMDPMGAYDQMAEMMAEMMGMSDFAPEPMMGEMSEASLYDAHMSGLEPESEAAMPSVAERLAQRMAKGGGGGGWASQMTWPTSKGGYGKANPFPMSPGASYSGKGRGKSVGQILEQWSLNSDAQTSLFNLTPECVAQALSQFNPKGAEGRDVNGKFIVFANSIAKGQGGHRSGRSVADFVNQWSLNEDSQKSLFKLTPDAMANTIASFAPNNAEGRDVNGKFIMFVSHQLKGGGKGAKMGGKMGGKGGKMFGKGGKMGMMGGMMGETETNDLLTEMMSELEGQEAFSEVRSSPYLV